MCEWQALAGVAGLRARPWAAGELEHTAIVLLARGGQLATMGWQWQAWRDVNEPLQLALESLEKQRWCGGGCVVRVASACVVSGRARSSRGEEGGVVDASIGRNTRYNTAPKGGRPRHAMARFSPQAEGHHDWLTA